jgi:hypothetical protein
MSKLWGNLTRQWRDGVNFLLGIWLIVSPWALGYMTETQPAWNAYVVGVIVAVAAVAAIAAFHEWEEWVNVVLGAWLIASPWLLGFSANMTIVWNQAIVGVVVGILALWSAYSEHGRGRLAT